MAIIMSSRRWRWLPHRQSGSRVAAGWGLSASTALNFQPAAIREPDGLCGNQRHRREILMMGIMVPETC